VKTRTLFFPGLKLVPGRDGRTYGRTELLIRAIAALALARKTGSPKLSVFTRY